MGQAPSNSVRGIALLVIAITVGLTVLTWRASDSTADDPHSDELVQVDIGERGYAIPSNYLSHVSRDANDGSDRNAVLRALWPGLEPRTPENVQFWQRRHPTRQIGIVINKGRSEGYDRLQNALFYVARSQNPFGKVGEPASFDLLEYSQVLPRGSTLRYFVSADSGYRTPSGNPVVINCSDHTTDEDKEVFEIETLCTVDYRLEDGALLHFTFFMVNLEHWREIDTGVRSLVNSFRR